jgi:deoxyribonuclease-1
MASSKKNRFLQQLLGAKKGKKTPKALLLTGLIILVALATLIMKGETPELLREYIPQELHSIFYPPKDPSSLGLPSSQEGNTSIRSFDTSKRHLMNLHLETKQLETFYCGSTFDEVGRLDHSRSGFTFRRNEQRANRLEWEHIVPAEAFGQSFVEWRDGHPDCIDSKGQPYKGRRCASKNEQFRLMEADLYNLVPAIGEVNGDRSNYSFAMLSSTKREYGACEMVIEDQKAQPPRHRFGDIARIYMYMQAAYGRDIISNKNAKLFESWHKMDPVDQWECERGRRLAKIQGNTNMVLEKACREAGL